MFSNKSIMDIEPSTLVLQYRYQQYKLYINYTTLNYYNSVVVVTGRLVVKPLKLDNKACHIGSILQTI